MKNSIQIKGAGQIAFETYHEEIATHKLPKWEKLATMEKHAWDCAADAVMDLPLAKNKVRIQSEINPGY